MSGDQLASMGSRHTVVKIENLDSELLPRWLSKPLRVGTARNTEILPLKFYEALSSNFNPADCDMIVLAEMKTLDQCFRNSTN